MRCTCPRIAQEARLGAVAVKLSRQMKKPLHKTTALALAPRGGFEPPTLGLEVLCSIQLSYQGVRFYYNKNTSL